MHSSLFCPPASEPSVTCHVSKLTNGFLPLPPLLSVSPHLQCAMFLSSPTCSSLFLPSSESLFAPPNSCHCLLLESSRPPRQAVSTRHHAVEPLVADWEKYPASHSNSLLLQPTHPPPYSTPFIPP